MNCKNCAVSMFDKPLSRINLKGQPDAVLPAGRCCLVCSKINCSPHPLPDELFQYGCDANHFHGVGDNEQFQQLKKETTCEDFSPCR